jgi:hypothetical protein
MDVCNAMTLTLAGISFFTISDFPTRKLGSILSHSTDSAVQCNPQERDTLMQPAHEVFF